MTNFKKKKLAGYLFTIFMILVVIVGIIVFLITHLDNGVLAKYSKDTSETLIADFVAALQKGDESALDYIWYHKDSGKMLKELEDYDNAEINTVVSDEQDAYKGLKTLLADKNGNELIKSVFSKLSIEESKSKTQKIRKNTFINDETVLSYKDYGHTGLYYMYENTVDNDSTQFNSIADFNELFAEIADNVPTSKTSDALYLVHTSNGLKIDAYLFLKALGINDMIYTGTDSNGNVSFAGVAGINISTDYTTTSKYEIEYTTESVLESLVGFVESQDMSGLYAFVAEKIGDSDDVVSGELGNLLYNYGTLDENAQAEFESALANYEQPKCLLLRNSAGFLGCACLLKLKDSYKEAAMFIDSDSIGDNTISLFNCSSGIYEQFNDVLYWMGITDKNGVLVGANQSNSEQQSSTSNSDDDDIELKDKGKSQSVNTDDNSIDGEEIKDTEDTGDTENTKDSEDTNSSNLSNNSDFGIDPSNTDNYYSEEEIKTIEENSYSNEEEFQYFEGDGTYGGEDEDPALVDDPADKEKE